MTKLADKIKEALKAGRSGQYAKKSPYDRFGFTQNPFRLDVDPHNPDYLIEREEVLLEFAVQIGNAIRLFEEDSKAPFRHLLAHGIRGCGKSFLAHHFDREWDQIGFQDFNTLYADLSSWREPIELQEEFGSSTKTIETYEEFLKKIKLMEKPLIIFIDDLDYTITGTPAIPRIRDFMSDIEERAQFGVILIGFVSSLTLTVLLEADQKIHSRSFLPFFNPEYFFFPVFSKTEIKNMLFQRIRAARSPTELFSLKAIEQVSNYSLGIPTVALQLASACLNELIVQNIDKATVHIVNTVIDQLSYTEAVQLVETVDTDHDDETTSLLTPKRRDIVTAILSHQIREQYFFPKTGVEGLRSSDLAELFGVNLSTMNYHLKPLISSLNVPLLEAVEDVHDARSKIFCINWQSHMANVLEIITVYQHLRQEKYNIKPSAILLSRRKSS